MISRLLELFEKGLLYEEQEQRKIEDKKCKEIAEELMREANKDRYYFGKNER